MDRTETVAGVPDVGGLDWELEHRRAVLRALEALLAERERELSALLDELAAFEQRYQRILGTRYRRLADLAADLAARRLGDRDAPDPAPPRTDPAKDAAPARPVRESAKELFRRLARRIHPDLASDPADRARRTSLMALANLAYEQGDVDTLTTLLEDWELGPDSVVGHGPLPELTRVLRRIGRAHKRLEAVAGELEELHSSYLASLYKEAREADSKGLDLLEDMGAELDRLIARTESELDDVEWEQMLAWPGTPTA
jgi:Skp family chaperone for outer membrane proteins